MRTFSKTQTSCWLRGRGIYCEYGVASRGHRYLTAKHRIPAHENCNLQVKKYQSRFVPIVIHNFSNYDSHLFFSTFFN